MTTHKTLVIVGYFDWFSGYQEVGLVRALRDICDVEVIASDRVSPIFSDAHIARLGIGRRYTPGTRVEQGVPIHRVRTREWRAMTWSNEAVSLITSGHFDHIIQVMPGQLLPLAATVSRSRAVRSVLYGDNSAMYANLSPIVAALKFVSFFATKGALYTIANSRAAHLYGYTPETIERLHPFLLGKQMSVLPLAFDDRVFTLDEELRARTRAELGIHTHQRVVVAPGKIQTQKKFQTLVAAMARVRENHDVRLIFVGLDDGPASTALRAAITEHGADSYTTCLDFSTADRMNAIFNSADLGIWPTMPAITIQQAMGTGLRVVIPDNALVGHLVDDQRTGIKFRTGSDLRDTLGLVLEQEIGLDSQFSSFARRERRELNEWLSTSTAAARLVGGFMTGAQA